MPAPVSRSVFPCASAPDKRPCARNDEPMREVEADDEELPSDGARKSTSAKPTAPQLAANTPETNGSSGSQEVADKKAKRKSLVQAPPSVPEDESETPTPNAESA